MQLYATRDGKTSIEVIEGTFGRYMKLTREIYTVERLPTATPV